MAAAAAKAVPDEITRWWETFSNGLTVDDQREGQEEEPEPEVDSDSDSERAAPAEEEQNAGAVRDDKMAAHARVQDQGSAAAAAAAGHREEEEEEVPGDGNVRLQGGLLIGRKEAILTHAEPRATGVEIQDVKEEYIAEDSYGPIGGGMLQGRRSGKLQRTTIGTEIHDKTCSWNEEDHQVAGDENAGVEASESDGMMMAAAQAPVKEPSSGGAADRHCDEEEVSEDGYVQLQGGLLGRKRKAITTHAEPRTTGAEIQDVKEECIAEDSYAQIGGGLLQGGKMEATVAPGKLQSQTTGTEIHDKKCSGNKEDHQVAAEENAGVAASESDGKMTAAAKAPVEVPSSGGGADRHCDEEYVSGDCYVQLQGGLLGRKRKAIATQAELQTTGAESQNEKGKYISGDNYVQIGVGLQGRKREATATPGKLQMTTGHGKSAQGGCLRAENEMLRLQLVRKTEELEAEQIRRLKLELNLKNKEIESLEKQNEELRAENECYRKTTKPATPGNPRLLCYEYALGVRHGSASEPEQDGGNDSNKHSWSYAAVLESRN